MADLRRGQNLLSERDLFYSNGTTPLLIADLSKVMIKLIQHNREYATYTLKDTDNPSLVPNPEIQATGISQITVELTSSFTLSLKEGQLYGKLYLEKVDAEFIVDLEFKPIDLYEIVYMLL